MRTKRWQAGLITLVVAVGLLANAMPVAGGQLAQWYNYPGAVSDPNGGLAAVDGNPLVLHHDEYVVLEFPTDVNATNCPDLMVRLHIDGSSPSAIESTLIALSIKPPSTWWGFLGSANGDFICDTEHKPQGSLTGTWFDFSIAAPVAFFNGFVQCIKIANNNAGNITIDAVEAWPVDPAVMINTLITKVASFNLQQGIDNSLDAKLEAALQALEDVNANNDASAVNKLEAFISEVEAQRNKKITDAQATELIGDAQAIIAVLTGA